MWATAMLTTHHTNGHSSNGHRSTGPYTNGTGKHPVSDALAHLSTPIAPLPLPPLRPQDAPHEQSPHHEQLPLVGLPANTYDKIQDCVRFIRSRSDLVPEVVIVLGSGLGAIADEMDAAVSIPYAEIPHFHVPGVVGHPGRLVMGTLKGVPALVLQGRFHYYEGHPMGECFGGAPAMLCTQKVEPFNPSSLRLSGLRVAFYYP